MQIVIADDLGEHPHIGIPDGGATDEVLKKASSADHDVVWATVEGGTGGGLTQAQILARQV